MNADATETDVSLVKEVIESVEALNRSLQRAAISGLDVVVCHSKTLVTIEGESPPSEVSYNGFCLHLAQRRVDYSRVLLGGRPSA